MIQFFSDYEEFADTMGRMSLQNELMNAGRSCVKICCVAGAVLSYLIEELFEKMEVR